jgi:uncharacterized membrane protein
VEVGQIAALAIMLFVLTAWRKTASFKKFSTLANMGLMFIGMLLFLMQLHGYTHTKYAEEFPISRDDHSHAHADMDEEIEKPVFEGYDAPLLERKTK